MGLAALLLATRSQAQPLDQLIPNLFGGSLSTTIDITLTDRSRQQVAVVQRFRNLSAQVSLARSSVPIPSSSGAFSFAWDTELDTFVRSEQSLGSIFAERTQTLGRGRFSIGLAYQHVDFDTLDGDPLSNIRSVQPAFTQAYLDTLDPNERAIYANDIIDTRLALSLSFDLFYLGAAYGLTDTIDVSLALTLNRAEMSGNAMAMTLNSNSASTDPVGMFTSDQPGAQPGGAPPICSQGFRCATDSFSGSAFGTGDLFLRGKWRFADTKYADFAVAGVLTLPTGNADDFLGFHDPTFTPWLITSKTFWRISPHVNVGYSIRSDTDVSQFQWIAGADFLTTRWLTLVADFLGYYDHINGNVVQSALGVKTNPIGGLVLNVGFQLPVNREGLRADVIYTGQVEYTF